MITSTRTAPATLSGADLLQAAMREFRADRLEAARAHAAAVGDRHGPALGADAAILLARIARRQGQLDVALSDSARAVEASAAAADPGRECRARVQHAHALNALGLLEPALEEAYRARRLAEDSGEPAAEASAAEALAGVQWAMSHWPEAQESFQRMLALATAAGDLELQAVACGGLAGVEGQLARRPDTPDAPAGFRRALEHVHEYLRRARELGDVYAVRSARHNLAVAQMAIGDLAAARHSLDAVLAEAGGGEARALSLMNLADLDLQEGDPASALPRLEAAHDLLSAAADPGYLQGCCRALCDAHEALGRPAEALAWHRRYHAHWMRLSSERAQVHARALAVRYETDRAQAAARFERLRAESLERAALEDGLTGIANRRAFDRALAEAAAGAREGRAFALALLDLDHFKRINDRHSHLVGDEVLRRVGRLLATACRQQDLAARYGGEEFALLLAVADAGGAREACERVRGLVEREDWDAVSPGLVVRVSIGCLHVGTDEPRLEPASLLARADRRLYAAKAGGRNCVVASDPV